jgi:hypothetical protein
MRVLGALVCGHRVCVYRLSLLKGEGRVRVPLRSHCVRETPHLNPLPFERGEANQTYAHTGSRVPATGGAIMLVRSVYVVASPQGFRAHRLQASQNRRRILQPMPG